jgi:thioredoxin-like negative regulator of GroEL
MDDRVVSDALASLTHPHSIKPFFFFSFAPWCPACRQLHPTWKEFSEWTDDLGLAGVAQVDVTENPGLSGRFVVTALPTIFQ